MKRAAILIGAIFVSMNAKATAQLDGFIPNANLPTICKRFESLLQDYQNLSQLGDGDRIVKMKTDDVREILKVGNTEAAIAKVSGGVEVAGNTPTFELEGQTAPKAIVTTAGGGEFTFSMTVAGLCPYMETYDAKTAAGLLISEFLK